jgi:hypothetical protein
LTAAERKVARQIGKEVGKLAIAAARPVTGGDAALGAGGHAKRPRRLRTKTRIYPGADTVEVIVWGVPAGPWRWINDGTEPHAIRRRRRGPKSRMFVEHPGMTGYGVWDDAKRLAGTVAAHEMYVAVRGAVR